MTTEIQEAPLPEEKEATTRQGILQMIPQFMVNPVFTRQHLDREIVIGTIGDRGGGKSGSDAVVSIIDFMMAGKKVWSNMHIECNIEIDDITARGIGLNSGGIAHYESLPLDKNALLELDESYRGGCLVIEEINVQYSNVRRFMSNTNVNFNEVCQQLRKFKTSMIYNVIDEMFVDSQLRALTDIFLMSYDTAFDLDSLHSKKKTGVDFNWKVFPMSGYLCGEQGKYSVTKKALPPIYFHFHPWRGVYDTLRHQEKGIYSLTTKEKKDMLKAEVSIESSPELREEINEWSWLEEKALDIKKAGHKVLKGWELTSLIGVPLTRRIREALQMFGIGYDTFKQAYTINTETIIEVHSHAAAKH